MHRWIRRPWCLQPDHPYAIHLNIHAVEASASPKRAEPYAERVLAGRMAQAREDYRKAVGAFQEAAAIQDNLPYLEPPYWYYPVRQSLRAALLQLNRPNAAEREFRAALKLFPNNAWALYGLREALKAQGDAVAVAEADRRLDAAWAGRRDDLSLSRL